MRARHVFACGTGLRVPRMPSRMLGRQDGYVCLSYHGPGSLELPCLGELFIADPYGPARLGQLGVGWHQPVAGPGHLEPRVVKFYAGGFYPRRGVEE
jgi:hypothetical protein